MAETWEKYKMAKMDAEYYKDAYQDLAERYNELAKQLNEGNEIEEYLKG